MVFLGSKFYRKSPGNALQGSPEKGVALLRQILKTDPGNVQAHLILGTALAVEGFRNESVEHITAAIKLVPKSADAYNRLGHGVESLP